MGWFDEQIKQRMQSDDEAFAEAFEKMAGAVLGKPVRTKQPDELEQSQDAIEEILKYYHVKPQELPPQAKDIHEQLEYQLRPHGIMCRDVALRGEWYRDGMGIMLGSTVSGDIIVLSPKGVSGYRYYDRQTGKYISVNKKNAKDIDPDAICFYRPLPLKTLGIKEILKYLARIPSLSDIFVIVAITFLVTLLGMLTPKVTNLLFSNVVTSGEQILLIASMILLVGVTISSSLFDMIKNILTERVQTKLDISLESATMMRILSLPSSFFKQYSAGDLGSRINSLGTLSPLICELVFSIGLSSLFSLIYIGQIFQYAAPLAVPAIIIIASIAGFSLVSAFMQMKISSQTMQFKVKEQGLVYSMISGVSKIKLAGAEKRIFAKWAESYTKSAELLYSPPAFIKYNTVLTTAISLVGSIIIYAAAVQNNISTADYMAFNASYVLVSGAFTMLSTVALTAANIKPILELAKPILESVPETSDNKKLVPRLSGGIELNHVSFRYAESMPPVIDDLSLKIRPGQYVAIVGSTGCGKSTLMRLMLGFESPQKGAVYYDGQDLASLDLKSVRKNIGIVMQSGKLFQGDIYSNIVISSPYQLTLDDAWEAARIAGMDEDISNMPMGMHTLITEGSGGISGGQRQRIMIARAVASKPRILMFDEATSALDNITQKKVSDALDSLKCTRIVIAHRLSTIRQCDRIIVLDKGKIVEDGTYEELIEKDGFFKELVARQRVEEA